MLLDAGVDKKDLQTSNFSIWPVYGDEGEARSGYAVSNIVVAQLHDLDKAGGVVDAAPRRPATTIVVRNVYFDLDDNSELVAKARADAVKRARKARPSSSPTRRACSWARAVAQRVEHGRRTRRSRRRPPRRAARATQPCRSSPGPEALTVDVTLVFSIG